MAIDDVLNDLLTNTKSFLERNAMIIHGSPKSGSGPKKYVLQGTDNKGWKTAIGGNRSVPFYVCFPEDGFVGSASGPRSRAFDTYYISMREFSAATQSYEEKSATHFTLGDDGPPVMVTSKLNGCTFGIGSDARGSRLVSHLRPPGAGADNAARLSLDQGIRAGFQGGKLDVSVQSSGMMNGTVIGIRAGQGWTFYAQRFQMVAGAVGIIGEVQVYR
jgi:hypothetical protein